MRARRHNYGLFAWIKLLYGLAQNTPIMTTEQGAAVQKNLAYNLKPEISFNTLPVPGNRGSFWYPMIWGATIPG